MITVFICPRCNAKSFHPEDFRQGYCGRCDGFTACVDPAEWTKDELERVLREFPHDREAAMAAVFRWRRGVQSGDRVGPASTMHADFTCPRCFGQTSHHGYCGLCSEYTASVPPPQWTDDEWLRVMAEFRPNASMAQVAATVFQWRRTQSTPDSPPSTPDGGQ